MEKSRKLIAACMLLLLLISGGGASGLQSASAVSEQQGKPDETATEIALESRSIDHFRQLVGVGANTLVKQANEQESDRLHLKFDAVLRAHVVDGWVDYPSIKADSAFSQYLETIQQFDPQSLQQREEKLAFWINAYNALAIQGILNGLSPESFFGRISYFKTTDYEVGQRKLSLYNLEHDILRALSEPRMHFAIVCASMSCPKLRSEAYVSVRLEEQLENSARDFINDPTRNRFELGQKRARISKIFDWFEEDFSGDSGSVLDYIARYVDDQGVADQLRNDRFRVKYLRYDWNLNGIPPKD